MVKKLNWFLLLIVSIFLGVFGIDRFLMGQPFLGLLKLITFGGFGIWWLVDVILIASRYPFENIEWVDPLTEDPDLDSLFKLTPIVTRGERTQNQSTPSAATPLKVNWLFLLIISIIFGTLGIDRFIMGQVGWGLLKLITGGGFGIWWIIDIILIACKYPFENVEWV